MNTYPRSLVLAVFGIAVVLSILYFRPVKFAENPIAEVTYGCDDGRSISVAYYRGGTEPAPTADLPPTHSGYVELALDDGRTMSLPQTVSADGGRYANADESFVFWSKGNGALVLENDKEEPYRGCILISALREGSELTQIYTNSRYGFSIRYPEGYIVDPDIEWEVSTDMKNFRSMRGTKFSIPESMTTGTNLSSDTGIWVRELKDVDECSADYFTGIGEAVTIIEGDTAYSVASSTGAAAGNHYDETVYALTGSDPCIEVHYFVHYADIGNYPAGTVQEFDKTALLAQFDEIRRSLILK